MIFICTTLWHEEDNEMRTLLVSLLRLINYVHMRKNDKSLRKQERFNLEINIFFDNVFEGHNSRENPQKNLPSWLPKEFSEWQTLNKWVYSFGTILAELLHQRRLGQCVEDAKTVLTPYGGRLEYNIQGIDFHVHLKNAERVQRGKRWSMVMYLYYLIGYKIDACGISVNGDKERVIKLFNWDKGHLIH